MNYGFMKKAAISVLVATLIAGCGKKDEAKEGGASQVAAKVNGTELTVHQVNYALQRIPNLDQSQAKAASLQVVRSLVNQEVIAQQAVKDKLDRDPAVVQALDTARRQILAEAYMANKLGKPTEPSDVAVTEYFNKHPELFSKRKIYRLQEISIKAPKDKQEAIRAKLTASQTLNDFAAWLKAENMEAKAGQGVKAAEQLPLQLASKLAETPDGQAMMVNTPEGVLVIMVMASQLQPVTLEQAKPAIAKLLQNEERQKAAKAELDKLKAASKIEYIGEFADAAKEAPQPAPAAETEKPAPANNADVDAISKGVSGLN